MWAGVGQAIESAAIAAAGIVACALVVVLVWGVDRGFGGDPLLQWRVAVDAWLLGHGVDLTVALPQEAVVALGLEQAGRPFAIELGAWGIALVTLWLHWRSGTRIAELPRIDAAIAGVSGAIAAGLIGLGAAATALHEIASPSLAQSFAWPALVAAAGMLAAIVGAHGHAWLTALGRWLTVDEAGIRTIRAALRTGAGGAVGVLGVGALLVALGMGLRFVDGIVATEALEPTHLGVVVLFLVQLALAPVAIVWASAWAIGPGFALGRGSSVSPIGTDLGPVPSLPLLSAIEPNAHPWMLAVVVLPVLVGVAAGWLARQTLLASTDLHPTRWWQLVAAAIGGGLVAGAILGALAVLVSGAVGPGRLGTAGPDAAMVAGWGALEVGAGLLVGLLAGGRGAGALAGGFSVPMLVGGRERADAPVDERAGADAVQEAGTAADADADASPDPEATDVIEPVRSTAETPDPDATDVIEPVPAPEAAVDAAPAAAPDDRRA